MAGREELELLERVFLRLGSSDTDELLEKNVGRFLAPVLLKMASPHKEVKEKVLQLLSHINKQLKSRPKIVLPMDSLLQQYEDQSCASIIHNFDMVYIKMGFSRLARQEQILLVPRLISCVERQSGVHRENLLQLITPLIGDVNLPESPVAKASWLHLRQKEAPVTAMLCYWLDTLLLPYHWPPSQTVDSASSAAEPSGSQSLQQPAPAGLSLGALRAQLGEGFQLDADQLEKTKLGVLEFLAAGVLPEESVICHFLVGVADSRHSVTQVADRNLKRFAGALDWEKPAIVQKIYEIFLGTTPAALPKRAKTAGASPSSRPDDSRNPASGRLRQHLFQYLLRSARAADHFPANIQVIFDCLFGTSTTRKLQQQALRLVHHMCERSAGAKLKTFSKVLQAGVMKIANDTAQEIQLRSLAFEGIGKLSRRVPELFAGEIAVVQSIFTHLETALDGDLRQSVSDCLIAMISALQNPSPADSDQLLALLSASLEKESPQVRLVSVQYAHSVFCHTNLPSVYLCLLATGDSNNDVREEAHRGLFGMRSQHSQGSELLLPTEEKDAADFVSLLHFLLSKARDTMNKQKHHVVGMVHLPFAPSVLNSMLSYLHSCLLVNAGVNQEQFVGGKYRSTVARHVGKLCDSTGDGQPAFCTDLLQFVDYVIAAPSAGSDLHKVALSLLLTVASCRYQQIAPLLLSKFDAIKALLSSSQEDVRRLSADLVAVISTCLGVDKMDALLADLYRLMTNKHVESLHGSLCCFGAVLSVLRQNRHAEVSAMASRSLTAKLVRSLVGHLGNDPLIASAACRGLTMAAAELELPLEDGGSEVAREEVKMDGKPVFGFVTDKRFLVEKLSHMVGDKDKKEAKLRECAVTALGALFIGQPSFPHFQKAFDICLGLWKVRQIELQFVVGEALSCLAVGGLSLAAPEGVLYRGPVVDTADTNSERVSCVIQSVFKHCKMADEGAREAACIWLLSLVKHCDCKAVLQPHLHDIQQTFLALLTESSDIVQEVASRGLSLVFEHCSEDQRKELVDRLTDTLMVGRRAARPLEADTKIFEEGEVGQTPDGSRMSTYKELCSMASDLNQPDLVYRFMNLANHHAIWNSKKGAAFGFSFIAAHSKESLAPLLPTLIPKLYRYQFDPNVKVQLAMVNIWKSLVEEPLKAVEEHFPAILSELLHELTSKLWRVRQSCCLGVADLLRTVRVCPELVAALPQLWTVCLRVLDDIKETVRVAAEAACRVLSKLTIRVCDKSRGQSGQETVGQVLPVLLHKGMISNVDEVKAVSLATILQISKQAGSLLKPHVPLLVPALMESLSGLEPRVMSYLALHCADSQDTQDKLDSIRIAAMKMSPMMEAANRCIEQIDAEVLGDLISSLLPMLKTGVGVGTRAGCAQFVISLCHHSDQDLAPYAGKLLAALLNGLADRSPGVRKAYASCIGHLVKVAKDSSIEKLVSRLRSWYLEKEDEELHHSCALTLQAVSQHSTDVMQRHSALCLPLAFLAMHKMKKTDNQEESGLDTASVCEDIWQENTPGTEGGVRIHLAELVELLCPTLSSQSWLLKSQAAAGLETVAAKLGGKLPSEHRSRILSSLCSALDGRVFDGKEALLHALGVIGSAQVPEGKEEKEEVPVSKVADCLLAQCRRRNRHYRCVAMTNCGRVLTAHSIDRLDSFLEIAEPILGQNASSSSDDSDGESSSAERRSYSEELRCAVYTTLGQAWPPVLDTQVRCQAKVCGALVRGLSASSWKVCVAVLNCVPRIASQWQVASMTVSARKAVVGLSQELLTAVAPHICDAKYSAVRATALHAVQSIAQHLSKYDVLVNNDLEDLLHHQLHTLSTSQNSAQLHDRAKSLLETYFG